MSIGDHQLHAAQAAPRERTQETDPEGLRLGGADRHPKHLAHPIGVHGNGDYDCDRDDPAGLANHQVRRIDPQVRPVALDRPVEKGVHALVDLGALPKQPYS